MRRVIAVTLCVLMLLAVTLTGCEKKDPLLGTWTGTVELADVINEELIGTDEEMATYFNFSDLDIEFVMTFGEDGACTFEISKDSIDTMMEKLSGQMNDGMGKMIEDVLKQAGVDMSVEEYLTMMKMDMDALIEEALAGAVDESDFEDMTFEGYYKGKEGKLYLNEDGKEFDEGDYISYTLEGDKLTIQAPEDMDEDMARIMFPLVLTGK